MITAITLKNFKGIGDRMTIPLRPLTLLFGANSIGKSTVVQAIHYVQEILERGNANPDRTLAGGGAIDLGVFLNLLHRRDKERQMTIRIDLDLHNVDLPLDYVNRSVNFSAVSIGGTEDSNLLEDLKFEAGVLEQISEETKTAWVEMEIDWSPVTAGPVIRRYETAINGIPIARLLTSIDRARYEIEANVHHPLHSVSADSDDAIEKEESILWRKAEVENLQPELPKPGEFLAVKSRVEGMYGDARGAGLYLTQALVGPGDLLRERLREFRYIGPLRSTPPRNHQPSLTERKEDWANGIAAWDELYRNEALVSEVSDWMFNPEKLGTGYSLQLRRFKEIPIDSPLLNELFVALQNGTFFEDYDLDSFVAERDRYEIRKRLTLVEEGRDLEFTPYDIGIGISQVLPVAVGALATRSGILAIEQPELHLHPAVQVRLGDLFIESAIGERGNTLIIETHSEHLLLRIMRRLRETNAGRLPEGKLPIKPEHIAVLFVERNRSQTLIREMPLNEQGELVKAWPGGFFEEDLEEML
ncbi:MAG: AAA family ATPase [Blastocatellales bacterium]|nr:AAA family ATPase [Blastocatellales bacterium]